MPLKQFLELKASGRLPSPPGIAMEILRLTQRDDCTAEELARVIQPDPALTGRILQVANSAMAGTSRPITTVREATIRLGMQAVRNLSLGFSLVSSNRHGSCLAFDYDNFWSESIARAVACQELSLSLGRASPSEMFVLGLLSEIGKLALATVHSDGYESVLQESGQIDRELQRKAEQAAFNIDHVEVTVGLFADWGLPQDFQDAVNRQWQVPGENEGDSHDLLRVAVRIAAAFVSERSAPYEKRFVRERLRRFPGFQVEHLSDIWDRAISEWRRWGKLLGIRVCRVPRYDGDGAEEIALESGLRSGSSQVIEDQVTVLAVDDDAISLKLLTHHLERANYATRKAGSGHEALESALQNNPEVVIADWKMPGGMDGLDLCRSLRKIEAGKKMYFILLTGEGEEDRIVQAFDAGIDDYVMKPFKSRVLLARVKAGTRLIRLQRQHESDKQTMQAQMAELTILTRRLEKASITDPLTELPNRRFAMQELRRRWEDFEKRGRDFAVVMIDIDYFKDFNDQHGHDLGDYVLRETARVLRRSIRDCDEVCRLGGEEFCLILPSASMQEGIACAERTRKAVEESRFVHGQVTAKVAISLGVAVSLPEMESQDDLLKASDEALYIAKGSGRNRVVAARPRAVEPL